MALMNRFTRGLLYMSIAVTCEVIFTGIKRWPTFQGKTQLWVLPLYFFCSTYLFEPMYYKISRLPFPIRGFIYGMFILCMEYIAGFSISKLIGSCPWKYRYEKCGGYINPYYLPLWAAMGLAGEYVCDYFDSIYIPSNIHQYTRIMGR